MAEYIVDIQNHVSMSEEMAIAIETAVHQTLKYHTYPTTELAVLITDDKGIQQLNLDFRQIDAPTDVLSFPSGEEAGYLGDIAIALPYTTRQAEKTGNPLLAELQLLAVHGTLHLLGYDHLEPEEKEEMWQVQTAVLQQLGLHQVMITE